MAGQVVERHGGQIPRDLDALIALGGVGRKTANVVLGTAFGIARGIVVDTHVKRLREKLGSGRDLLETVRGIGYRLMDPNEKR